MFIFPLFFFTFWERRTPNVEFVWVLGQTEDFDGKWDKVKQGGSGKAADVDPLVSVLVCRSDASQSIRLS